MSKITGYLDDVAKEMKKVSWPKRNELVDNTIVTLIGTVIIAAFIYGADQVISRVLQLIY